jgi:DNA-binding NtrC family response regulator
MQRPRRSTATASSSLSRTRRRCGPSRAARSGCGALPWWRRRSAEEALGKLEDRTLAVDVFVTDVIMPGMDGPSWVAKALETRPDTRVVFVSGYAEDSLAESRLRIPNSVFLPKPFSLKDLTATVQQQMH